MTPQRLEVGFDGTSRRLEISFGGASLVYERVRRAAVVQQPQGSLLVASRPRRLVAGSLVFAVLAATVVTVALLALFAPETRAGATDGSQIVRLSIPARAELKPKPQPRQTGSFAHPSPTVPTIAKAEPRLGGRKALAADHGSEMSIGRIEEQVKAPPVPGGELSTQEAAVAAAKLTGSFQQWTTTDGDERGFVIVGNPEDASGRCRSLSILVRRGENNKVERERHCAANAAHQESISSSIANDGQ